MLKNGWNRILHAGNRWDWYYFNSNGTMATGFIPLGGYWYYLASTNQNVDFYSADYGVMRMGWQQIFHGNKWDYFYFAPENSSGRMVTGWLPCDGSWFYFADGPGQGVGFNDSDYGVMRTSWQQIYHSGRWDYYYFKTGTSGRMLTGDQRLLGTRTGYNRYYFADDASCESFYSSDYGVMLKGMQTFSKKQYYYYWNPGWVDYEGWGFTSGANNGSYETGAMLHDCTISVGFGYVASGLEQYSAGSDGLLAYLGTIGIPKA